MIYWMFLTYVIDVLTLWRRVRVKKKSLSALSMKNEKSYFQIILDLPSQPEFHLDELYQNAQNVTVNNLIV